MYINNITNNYYGSNQQGNPMYYPRQPVRCIFGSTCTSQICQ